MSYKDILSKILLIIILSFLLVFSFSILKMLFFEESTFLYDSSAAFLGAFFAFLFVRIGDGFNKIYERHIKHYNALVKLEYLLNYYFIVIDTNLMILKDYEDILEKTKNEKKINFSPHHLRNFKIDDDIILSIFGQHIRNSLLDYNFNLYKFNGDIDMTNRRYEEIKKRCLDDKDVTTYIYNLETMVKEFYILNNFLNTTRKKNIKLLAAARILMEEKPVFTKIMFKILPTKESKKYNKKVEKETEILQKELEETFQKNKEEIDKMLSKDIK